MLKFIAMLPETCCLRKGSDIPLVENQELSTVLLEHLLDEFGVEAGESVSVGDHKCEFISAMKSLQ